MESEKIGNPYDTLSDKESERKVIGTMLVQYSQLADCRDIITNDCFTEQSYLNIAIAAIALFDRGEQPDIHTVYRELLKQKKSVPISDLLDASNYFLHSDCRIEVLHLRDLATRRRLYIAGQQLIQSVKMPDVDVDKMTSDLIQSLNETLMNENEELKSLRDIHQEVHEQAAKNAVSDKPTGGTPTGLRTLDETVGGLSSGELMIIAADTSMGKSALATTIAVNAARNGDKICYYSFEMPNKSLDARILSAECGLTAQQILSKKLSTTDFNALAKAMDATADLPIFFEDKTKSKIDHVIASIRRAVLKHHVNGAVVDYIQILSTNAKDGETEEIRLATIARKLKDLAIELGIWIIALSQINRDKDRPYPSLSRIRGSAQINDAADIVLLLFRAEKAEKQPCYYPPPFDKYAPEGTAMIEVAKARNAELTKFIVGFDGPTTRFFDSTDLPLITTVSKPTTNSPEMPF